jgi:hypothetical protein
MAGVSTGLAEVLRCSRHEKGAWSGGQAPWRILRLRREGNTGAEPTAKIRAGTCPSAGTAYGQAGLDVWCASRRNFDQCRQGIDAELI